MRAATYESYGGPEVVHIAEMPTPEVGPGELLVRVRAFSVNTGDWRLRSMTIPGGMAPVAKLQFGWSKPKKPILGTEAAGIVERVGAGVSRFAPGDEVCVSPGWKMGCHAEYVTIAEDAMVEKKPANLEFAEAAALGFGGSTALWFFRKAGLKAGERLLVVGASGAVGSAAVQIGKALGAVVTGVASTGNLELVRALGADAVIDYTRTDLAAGGGQYDVILDTTASAPYKRVKSILAPNGRLLLVLAGLGEMLFGNIGTADGHQVITGTPPDDPLLYREMVAFGAAGKYRPLIDSRYRLDQIVAAHARVDTGRKRGSVVVEIP